MSREKEEKQRAEEIVRMRAEEIRDLQKHFAGHKSPKTRREFLSRGLVLGTSYVMMPSLLSLLPQKTLRAQGLDCPSLPDTGSTLIPLMVFDFAGGAPLNQEIYCGGPGGQMDVLSGNNAYLQYGIPSDIQSTTTADTEFGLVFRNNSAALQGLRAGISPAFRDNVDGFSLACDTNDDTANNMMNPALWLPKLGRFGTLTATVGTNGISESGGRSAPSQGSYLPQFDPVQARTRAEARNLVTQGTLVAALQNNEVRANSVREALSQMSSSQLLDFSNMSINEQLSQLIRCGHINAPKLLQQFAPTAIFPDNGTPEYTSLVTSFGPNPENSAVATIARLLLGNFAGAGTVEIGNRDNHNNTAATPRSTLFEDFRLVGQVINYFLSNNKPVMILCITDGSMGRTNDVDNTAATGTAAGPGQTPSANYSPGGGGLFNRPGDGGNYTAHLMFVADPSVSRTNNPTAFVQNAGRQIGAFTPNGVNTSYLITAQNPSNMSLAAVYNYLLAQGLEDKISTISLNGNNPFEGTNHDKYAILKKIT